jgi:hypothetical protein
MLTIVASLLLAASIPVTDFSADCLTELGYDAMPKTVLSFFCTGGV